MKPKSSNKAQAGTTVNPAPQPAAPSAPARGESTAQPIVGQVDPVASAQAQQFEADALAMLAGSIEVGSGDDEGTVELARALTGDGAEPQDRTNGARARKPVSKKQPVADVEENAGEHAIEAEDGDPSEGTAATEADGIDQTVSNDADAEATETPEASDTQNEQEQEQEQDATDEAGEEEDGRKWPKSYLKRINKLTAKLERYEEAAQDAEILREENARLKQQLESGVAQAPGLPVTSAEESLTKEIETIERNLETIEANPNGLDVGDKSYSPDELRQLKRRFEDQLMDKKLDLREAQRERKATAQRIESTLAEWHPDLAQAKSPKRTAVEGLLARHPILKADPFFKLLVAEAVAYRMSQAKTNGNGNGAMAPKPAANGSHANGAPRPAVKPAPRPPGKPMVQPVVVNRARATTEQVQKRYMETGDEAAGRQLIESLIDVS